jgi:uncharacterized protein (DUF1501 family)
MFNYGAQRERTCGGISRRSLLQIGGLSLCGLSLPRILAAQAASPTPRRELNCILLWMGGGVSNIDTFDMKPDAPAEYRGEFKPISTNLPGTFVCEHLPQMAQRMDKLCVLKSIAHTESGDHGAATHYMLTGYPQRPDPNGQPANSLVYPFYGSVVAREQGWRNSFPPAISLGAKASPYEGPGYIGSAYEPLVIKSDPNKPNFSVQDVTIPESIGVERTQRRRGILAELDRWQRQVDATSGALLERNQFYAQAYDLITSPAAKKAFNISEESDKVRDRYGRNEQAQSALLARRLIEAGARFVTLNTGQWDTHQNNFNGLKDPTRLPGLDQYWSALLDDLAERGLLETTLVVWMGEFGRTPTINGAAGRDHWAPTNSICFSGAGIKMGITFGETDAICSEVSGIKHSTHDFAATIYHLLGIDSTKEYMTPDNRPVLINYHGQPIRQILA